VTQQEDEAKETWRAMDQQKRDELKSSPLANWGFEGEGLVKSAPKLIKVLNKRFIVILDPDKFMISTVCMIGLN
jgi:hypothetical protein